MINPQSVLDVPMQENDAGAATIRDYLVTLLGEVWKYDEGFDGKRPFGNSGWKGDLTQALARAGILQGDPPDEYGWVETTYEEEERGEHLIASAITSLGWVQAPEPPSFA